MKSWVAICSFAVGTVYQRNIYQQSELENALAEEI